MKQLSLPDLVRETRDAAAVLAEVLRKLDVGLQGVAILLGMPNGGSASADLVPQPKPVPSDDAHHALQEAFQSALVKAAEAWGVTMQAISFSRAKKDAFLARGAAIYYLWAEGPNRASRLAVLLERSEANVVMLLAAIRRAATPEWKEKYAECFGVPFLDPKGLPSSKDILQQAIRLNVSLAGIPFPHDRPPSFEERLQAVALIKVKEQQGEKA